MVVLVCALVFGGPLLVAVSSVLLVVSSGAVSADVAHGVVTATLSLAAVVVAGAGGASVLFRWCFIHPPVRGIALLTGLLLAVFFLSHDLTVAFLAKSVVGAGERKLAAGIAIDILTEMGLLLGIAVAICTLLVLVVELPLRWAQGRETLISDGAFRMLRWVGVIVVLVAVSSSLREEAILRLGLMFKRAIG
jgi:hypothetical protein